MTLQLKKFWGDQSAATMVEYALMLALIAMVAFAAVQLLGLKVRAKFEDPTLDAGLT